MVDMLRMKKALEKMKSAVPPPGLPTVGKEELTLRLREKVQE